MRSRLAVTVLLATGMLTGGASAAMGASALSTATDASALQYGSANVPVSTIGSAVPVPVAALGQSAEPTENDPNEVLSATSGPETVAARQVAAAQDELPFTGYAPIPILLAGLLLLGLGVVLRRRNPQPARP